MTVRETQKIRVKERRSLVASEIVCSLTGSFPFCRRWRNAIIAEARGFRPNSWKFYANAGHV